jgi:YVTN family beta-propeller protein
MLRTTALTALFLLGACAEHEDPLRPDLEPLDDLLDSGEVGGVTKGVAVPTLSISSSLEPGETSRFTVAGANPGESVRLLFGTRGLGNGPCLPAPATLCAAVRQPTILTANANNAGVATFNMPVPTTVPAGGALATQAVLLRGPANTLSVASNARLDVVGPINRLQPTNGNAVALTDARDITVSANRTAGEITVHAVNLNVAAPTATPRASISTGDGIPYNVVIGGNDDTAFVVVRGTGSVMRISDLRGTPTLNGEVFLGGEPTGIAISPAGTHIYVTSFTGGNVWVIDTQSLAITATVDLNPALVASGLLGPSITNARPGLARPWSVVVTDDGDDDDDDEKVYVTEFFSQDDPTKSFAALGDAYFDEGRQGIVYTFDVATRTVAPVIKLSSVANTGFNDSLGQPTGCHPNQLYSSAIANGRLYVGSVCASPRGPAVGGGVNSKTKVHGLLSVVNLSTNTEIVTERVVLTKAFEDMFIARPLPDDGSRRFPLIPNALAFVPGTTIAYVTGYGSDALFRVEFDTNGGVLQIGSGFAPFIPLNTGASPGRLPIGLALSGSGDAVVLNENSRNLSFVDLGTQSLSSTHPSATPVAAGLETELNEGRRFFVTGLGRWSLNGQGWNSCEGCHPDGLTDNVSWYFAAGPRQSTSLDASFAPDGSQRIFNWTAIIDEVGDFENNTRGVSGGIGAFVDRVSSPASASDRIIFDGTHPAGTPNTNTSQVNLNGAIHDLLFPGVAGLDRAAGAANLTTVLQDWARIEAYMTTIRSSQAPVLNANDVAAGRQLFTDHGCKGCHGGENWTISERFYTPSQTNNAVGGLLDTTTYSLGNLPAALNPFGANPFLRSAGSISCVLRSVGTFGAAPAGVTVSERKENMVDTATGATGYNPPSLLGAGSGAPYFHAGNARTLEEVLSSTFLPHTRALDANFAPTPQEMRQLAAFLTSIDDNAPTLDTAVGPINTIICPATFP